MSELLTFTQALDASSEATRRHVLLGNGFSISCFPNIFRYDRLFEQADFTNSPPEIRATFNALGTSDFERVIRALRDFSQLLGIFVKDSQDLQVRIETGANTLREILVRTIASSHPSRPGDISPNEYAHCRRFLANFDKIFTLNYDLLLYWSLMQKEILPDVECDDGFRKPEDNWDASYVSWEPENTNDQNVYYLHGGLHIFDAGYEVQKYTWTNTGVALIDQIRESLENDMFPIFVAEGKSTEKLERIRHSDFLSKASRSLQRVGGALFIHGHSLAENDDHILRLIPRSKVTQIFVSIFGDVDSASNKEIIRRANYLGERKRGKRGNLEVNFYDAQSANVWR